MIEYYKNKSLESLFYINENGLVCQEVWKGVPNYESHYEISNLGRVKSIKFKKELILKQCFKRGYLFVWLYNKEETKQMSVHRLVGISFIDNSENKSVINHKKGIKTDNRYWMIEWNTIKENTIHAYSKGYCSTFGANHKCSKLKEHEVLKIRELRDFNNISYGKIAKRFNVSKKNIINICKGLAWKHLLQIKKPPE